MFFKDINIDIQKEYADQVQEDLLKINIDIINKNKNNLGNLCKSINEIFNKNERVGNHN